MATRILLGPCRLQPGSHSSAVNCLLLKERLPLQVNKRAGYFVAGPVRQVSRSVRHRRGESDEDLADFTARTSFLPLPRAFRPRSSSNTTTFARALPSAHPHLLPRTSSPRTSRSSARFLQGPGSNPRTPCWGGARRMVSSAWGHAVPCVDVVVVDFDSTCTEVDSSPLLAQLTLEAASERVGVVREEGGLSPSLVTDVEREFADLEGVWKQLVEQYEESYAGAIESSLSKALEDHPRCPHNLAGLHSFLSHLSKFEEASISRVTASHALRGLSRERIRAAALAGRAPLRPGCSEVLLKIAEAGAPLHILTVNWSRDLVLAALPSEIAAHIHVHGNDLETSPDGLSTGAIVGGIHTPLDKARVFAEIARASPEPDPEPSGRGKPRRIAYLGDSLTDLLALVGADLPMVIGNSKSLRRVAEAFQISLLSPSPGTSPPAPKGLVQVSDWRDVEALLFSGHSPDRYGSWRHGASSSSPSGISNSRVPREVGKLAHAYSGHGTTSVPEVVGLGTANPAAAAGAAAAGLPTLRGSANGALTGRVMPGGSLSGHKDRACAASSARPGADLSRQAQRLSVPACAARVGDGGGALETAPEAQVARVLAIGGSDSGGGAGIQADLKACAARGAFCTTAITAVTAQNTHGVQGIHAVPVEMLARQLESVLADIGADVVKTGMLPSEEAVAVVAKALQERKVLLVVDPVLVATSGDSLATTGVAQAMKDHLFPLADLVTPNLPEASALLGREIGGDVESMRKAARDLASLGPRNVIVKGGHAKFQDDDDKVVDVFFDGVEFHELRVPRVRTRNSHGTGCTLASSVAAELAKGAPMLRAIKAAKEYLTEALHTSSHLSISHGPQGPINHAFAVSSWGIMQGPPNPSSISGWPSPGSARSRFHGADLLLYAVTDSSLNTKWQRSNVDAVRGSINGRATFLQLREKLLETGDFVKEALAVVALARAASVPLVINDRIDVALAAGADGVHLGQSDMSVAVARRVLGPDAVIGVSCKTPEQARRAAEDGADYIGVGGVFPTTTKENNKTIGIEGLLEVCRASPLPVVAIGGIKATNAGDVLRSAKSVGCDGGSVGGRLFGVAIVSGVFDQEDVAAATQSLMRVINSAHEGQ